MAAPAIDGVRRAWVDARPWAAVAALNAVLGLLVVGGLGALAVVAALAVPALLAVLDRPQRGLLLLALLLPFDGLLLLVEHPPVVDGWKEALVVATALAALVAPPGARRTTTARPPWLPALVALGLLATASAVAAADVAALLGLKIVLFPSLVAFVAWRCPLDGRERDRLVSVLMATGVATAAVGLAQQAVGHAALRDLGYEYDSAIRFSGDVLRSFSTFTQPFSFAFFLVLVLLVGVPVALADWRRVRNALFLLACPLLGLALGAAVVRAAWLGLGAGLLLLAVRRHRLLLLGVPVLLTGLLVLPDSASTSAFSADSVGARRAGWAENAAAVVDAPLGLGIGTTGVASGRAAELAGEDFSYGSGAVGEGASVYQPDNYWFKTLLELGVLGLWLLAALLWLAFRTAWRAAARTPGGDDSSLALGVAAAVLASAVAAVFSMWFEIFPLDLYFWLLVGVASALGGRGGSEPAAVEPALVRTGRTPGPG